jgi:hypothetical protein
VDVVEVETAFPTIFQPLVEELISADLIFVDFRGIRSKTTSPRGLQRPPTG